MLLARSVEVGQLRRDPGPEIVLADVGPDRLPPRAPLVLAERERELERVGDRRDVEGIDRNDPVLQLLE